ncbi:MAG: hypothetical protein KFF72_06840 [Arthrospira sp. SH-MAG29]|nr:hypothetical protein [Arthrospira sp. SH-MAG29]MBS0016069.1 hypothetical protein [Arthrospira sp. SH-MAG29]
MPLDEAMAGVESQMASDPVCLDPNLIWGRYDPVISALGEYVVYKYHQGFSLNLIGAIA